MIVNASEERSTKLCCSFTALFVTFDQDHSWMIKLMGNDKNCTFDLRILFFRNSSILRIKIIIFCLLMDGPGDSYFLILGTNKKGDEIRSMICKS